MEIEDNRIDELVKVGMESVDCVEYDGKDNVDVFVKYNEEKVFKKVIFEDERVVRKKIVRNLKGKNREENDKRKINIVEIIFKID